MSRIAFRAVAVVLTASVALAVVVRPRMPKWTFGTTVDGKAKSSFFAASDEAPPYPALYFHLKDSDLVLVGKAGALIRQGRTPWDMPSKEPTCENTTVRSFTVEKALKGKPDSDVIKIAEFGAVLNGQGYFLGGCPRLVEGKRYLVFLRRANGADLARGFKAYVRNGVTYNNGDADELTFANNSQSKILIEDGVLKPPYDDYQSGSLEPYYDRYSIQLAGATEAQAETDLTKAIQDTTTRWNGSKSR